MATAARQVGGPARAKRSPAVRTAGTRPAPRLAALPDARARNRRVGGLGIAAVATVVALVVAVVFHVVLAQNQLLLDHLGTQTARQQRIYEERRLRVARLSAPDRVIAAAERLGLVMPPDPPVYLQVEGAPVPPGNAVGSSTTLGDWKKVKPNLGEPQP